MQNLTNPFWIEGNPGATQSVGWLGAFVADGAPAGTAAVTAMSVEAGTRWLEAYGAASAAGLYVQGGGCTSVGASGGFVQGSGFGSFSMRFGTGAAGVLEFEVVTADGEVRVVNEHQEPDLFWALRGGGGSTWGVVARTTLLAHPIPEVVGTLSGSITAPSDEAYRDLIVAVVDFYPGASNNPNLGEQLHFGPDNEFGLAMTFLDLSDADAGAVWAPLLDSLRADPAGYAIDVTFRSLPFDALWDVSWWEANDPDFVTKDPRPGQPPNQYWWSSNQGEVSAFWAAYQSRWVPLSIFHEAPDDIGQMLFDASREGAFTFQINKGVSGEHPEAAARDQQTAIHPDALDAAGLIIIAR